MKYFYNIKWTGRYIKRNTETTYKNKPPHIFVFTSSLIIVALPKEFRADVILRPRSANTIFQRLQLNYNQKKLILLWKSKSKYYYLDAILFGNVEMFFLQPRYFYPPFLRRLKSLQVINIGHDLKF